MKVTSKLSVALVAGAIAIGAAAGSASAYTIDSAGFGFVGKGEVQLALGLNNHELQAQAGSLVFEVDSKSETETTWICRKDGATNTQERARTTTTTTEGVLASVARVKNQITGFNLNGYSGSSTTTTTHEGPAVGSCPTNWTADDPVVGDPVETGGGLTVNSVTLP